MALLQYCYSLFCLVKTSLAGVVFIQFCSYGVHSTVFFLFYYFIFHMIIYYLLLLLFYFIFYFYFFFASISTKKKKKKKKKTNMVPPCGANRPQPGPQRPIVKRVGCIPAHGVWD